MNIQKRGGSEGESARDTSEYVNEGGIKDEGEDDDTRLQDKQDVRAKGGKGEGGEVSSRV